MRTYDGVLAKGRRSTAELTGSQYDDVAAQLTPEIAMAKIKIQENVNAQADLFPNLGTDL